MHQAAAALIMITHLVGGIPGSPESAPVAARITFAIPDGDNLPTIALEGQHEIPYFLSGNVIRLRGEDIPTLEGELVVDGEETPLRIRLDGLERTMSETTWGNGHDITVRGLGLRGRVYRGDATQPLVTIRYNDIALTTGLITVGKQPVRGKIDPAHQRIHFVGSFPMPVTGISRLDAQLRDLPVLIRVTLAATMP
jgi:hypothetical protein